MLNNLCNKYHHTFSHYHKNAPYQFSLWSGKIIYCLYLPTALKRCYDFQQTLYICF